MSERNLLLSKQKNVSHNRYGLSLFFASICIIDIFGVYPIITLPKNILNCGYYGIFIILLVSSMQIYTAILLGRCWLIAEELDKTIENKNRYPYSALAEITYGQQFSKFVTFLLDITVFGGGIPNLIVASQTLQLLGRRMSDSSFDISFCYWILIMGFMLCPLLWFGSPKDMKLLCTISTAIVLSVFVCAFGSMSLDFRDTNELTDFPPSNKQLWQHLLTAYGVLTFQFDIHPTILTIQVDMQEKRHISKAIMYGFGGSLIMFAVITITAGIKYDSATQPSLLGTLPSSVSLHIAALLVALQLGLTSAISNSALYQHMEDCLGIAREFNHRRCILRTLLSIIAIILAESVPQFDIVMSLIGGTFIGPLAYILPPLFYIKIKQLKRKYDGDLQLDVFRNAAYAYDLGKYETIPLQPNIQFADELSGFRSLGKIEWILCIVIILFGISSTLSMTYINVHNMIEYSSFSQPCIYNLTLLSPF